MADKKTSADKSAGKKEKIMNLTKEQLELLLKETSTEHGKYEKTIGHYDDDWPAWYAEYMIKKIMELL
ncbi:MAG: hypothetical protein HYW51_03570 [Candidatus Doudnabacteria bacterium]|nr:hypothetical protein [Candidatus Doudnabacteria bacterium]